MKICLVGSSGWSLDSFVYVKAILENKIDLGNFDKEDARSVLEGEKCILVIIQQIEV